MSISAVNRKQGPQLEYSDGITTFTITDTL